MLNLFVFFSFFSPKRFTAEMKSALDHGARDENIKMLCDLFFLS